MYGEIKWIKAKILEKVKEHHNMKFGDKKDFIQGKTYINYDENFKKQRENAIRLEKNGNFDKIILYLPTDIDKKFYEKNKNILSQKRSGGYWLWKPYFIVKTLEKM